MYTGTSHTGFSGSTNYTLLGFSNVLTRLTLDDHPHSVEHGDDPNIYLVYYNSQSPTKKPVLQNRMILTEGTVNQPARLILQDLLGTTTTVVNDRSIFGGASLQRTTLSDDYLVVYYSPLLNSENFTLTAHIYPVASISGLSYIFSRWGSDSNSWRLQNDLRLEINTFLLPTVLGNAQSLSLDKWQNIALTYNSGNREFIVYLDGAQISRFNHPVNWSPYNTNDLELGRGTRGYYDNFAMLRDTLPVVKFESQSIKLSVDIEEIIE